MNRIAACLLSTAALVCAQHASPQAEAILKQVQQLRKVPDAERAKVTRDLALEIRQLPLIEREGLADALSNFATEGDFGRDTLQEVTNTLAQALAERPGRPESYLDLARLARYEHMQVSLDSPHLKAAMARLEADDQARQRADFTLTDLSGRKWTLKSLSAKSCCWSRATWCPPCRKEMPDMEALYRQFETRGLVISLTPDRGRR